MKTYRPLRRARASSQDSVQVLPFLKKKKEDKQTNIFTRRKRKNLEAQQTAIKKQLNLSGIFIKTGIGFLVLGVVIFILTFYPVLKEEAVYLVFGQQEDAQVVLYEYQAEEQEQQKPVIVPEDPNFGVVIPKIRANTNVIPQVDPYNEREYQLQLSRGVAHAKGTALPNQDGNIFLFAHSAGDFYEANRYNAIFYLLNKLEQDDDIYIFYEKQPYHFRVTETKIVDASEVQYLQNNSDKNQVTLMTCWPAGTTLKRLIVIGEKVEDQ